MRGPGGLAPDDDARHATRRVIPVSAPPGGASLRMMMHVMLHVALFRCRPLRDSQIKAFRRGPEGLAPDDDARHATRRIIPVSAPPGLTNKGFPTRPGGPRSG